MYEVVTRLTCRSRVSLPWVWIGERIPLAGRFVEGTNQGQGRLSRDRPVELAYSLACPAAGRLCFDGLRVQIADLQGFFQSVMFIRQFQIFRVYPALVDSKGYSPSTKRHNVLPILGTHRHRRPGSGSELLDFRDYLPGDPPKMIAWKASARRDRLMTKELESEVPVRCTLFVDVSSSVRVGKAGENVLARLIEIAATVVQASAAAKDLTGLCLSRNAGWEHRSGPARGSAHVHRILGELADVADLPLQTEHVALDRLLPLAFALRRNLSRLARRRCEFISILASLVGTTGRATPATGPCSRAMRPAREFGAGCGGSADDSLIAEIRSSTIAWSASTRLSPYERRKYRWRKHWPRYWPCGTILAPAVWPGSSKMTPFAGRTCSDFCRSTRCRFPYRSTI